MPVRDKIQGGILLLCVGLLVLYGTYGAVTVFFTRQVVSSPQSNTLCTGDEAPRICKTSGPLQFKKVLLIYKRKKFNLTLYFYKVPLVCY